MPGIGTKSDVVVMERNVLAVFRHSIFFWSQHFCAMMFSPAALCRDSIAYCLISQFWWVHPKLLCCFVAPYFAGPENPQRLSHNQFTMLYEASESVSH